MKLQIYGLMISHGPQSGLTFSFANQRQINTPKAILFLSRNKNNLLCPVSLTLLYFKRFNLTSGFLLPSLKGQVPDSSKPLAYVTALKDLRRCLALVNIDPSGFGEHSGRRSGTTAAATSGASIDELMLQGRWRSTDMPHLYTDNASKMRREFAIRLSKI